MQRRCVSWLLHQVAQVFFVSLYHFKSASYLKTDPTLHMLQWNVAWLHYAYAKPIAICMEFYMNIFWAFCQIIKPIEIAQCNSNAWWCGTEENNDAIDMTHSLHSTATISYANTDDLLLSSSYEPYSKQNTHHRTHTIRSALRLPTLPMKSLLSRLNSCEIILAVECDLRENEIMLNFRRPSIRTTYLPNALINVEIICIACVYQCVCVCVFVVCT